MRLVIADASCLIALDNVDEIELLHTQYEHIYVTPEVANEVGDSLPDWIEKRASSNHPLIDQLTSTLEIGEATSIALAIETADCILIIDEKKGRRIAIELGIEITGTFGLIRNWLEDGLIADPATIVDRLEKAGFRISDAMKSDLRARIH
jgi:predicted nucleic acid-binding protein